MAPRGEVAAEPYDRPPITSRELPFPRENTGDQDNSMHEQSSSRIHPFFILHPSNFILFLNPSSSKQHFFLELA
jgi:hypothetical protein